MRDHSRRFLTLLIFLFLGPLLTAVILGAIGVRKLPIAAEREESNMRGVFSRDVRIESVEYLNPFLRKFTNFSLAHPTYADKPLVSIPELELRYKTSGTLRAANVNVRLGSREETGEIRFLQEMLFELFPERFSGKEISCEFRFENIDVSISNAVPEEVYHLSFFNGRFTSGPLEDRLECSFNMGDDLVSEPIRFTVSRGRDRENPELSVELDMNRTTVSARFLSLFFPWFENLGPKALLNGRTIRARSQSPGHWNLTFTDVLFQNVDLRKISEPYTTYQLSGHLNLGIDNAEFSLKSGDLSFLGSSGYIQIQNGSMEKGLFRNLIEQYQLVRRDRRTPESLPESPSGEDPLLRFRNVDHLPVLECIVVFELKEREALFQAAPRHDQLVLILDQNHRFYLPKEMEQWVPYSHVLYPFLPSGAELIPLTPQSQRIIKVLSIGE